MKLCAAILGVRTRRREVLGLAGVDDGTWSMRGAQPDGSRSVEGAQGGHRTPDGCTSKLVGKSHSLLLPPNISGRKPESPLRATLRILASVVLLSIRGL